MKRRNLVLLGMLAVAITATAASADTSIKPYVVPVGNEYEVKALVSVGDTVPWAKGSGQYRMVGIPDGLGAHANGDGTTTLYMNSELPSATLSEPLVGGAKNRGAIVSKWILDSDGDPIAGSRAYDLVFAENEFVGSARRSATRPVPSLASARAVSQDRRTGSTVGSTSRTRRRERPRTASTAKAVRRLQSSTTPCTRCRSWVGSHGRTHWCSRTWATAP
jgi:hypothetical protein